MLEKVIVEAERQFFHTPDGEIDRVVFIAQAVKRAGFVIPKEFFTGIDPEDVLRVREGLLDVLEFIAARGADHKLRIFTNDAFGFLKTLEGAIRERAAESR